MKEIIDVFKMYEVSAKTRVKIIIELGRIINHEYGTNLTESLVYELVKQLDKDNPILTDEHYLSHINK